MKTAKKLKKNNVAVDIVSFGCEEENSEKLEGFQQAVNSGDNSHLVTVPQGGVLSDTLFGSPICQTDGGAGYGAGPGGEGGEAGGSYQFGVDPNLDPELALALRVSLEEEQARQTSGPSGEPVTAAAEALQGAHSVPNASGMLMVFPLLISTFPAYIHLVASMALQLLARHFGPSPSVC